MFKRLDDDSLVNIVSYLSLVDALKNFAFINSDIYRLFNGDQQGYLIGLINHRILFSEEFAALFNHLDQHCEVESLLCEEERKIINCKELSRVCEEENHVEKKVLERLLSDSEMKCISIDSYAKMKTCWDIVKRLSYMNILWRGNIWTNCMIELQYSPDNQRYITYDALDKYEEFMKLAESYEFSRDRIYKFIVQVIDNGFHVKKVYSKPREHSHRNQKEIILKNKEQFWELSGKDSLYQSNFNIITHQESINNDITLSIPDIQDSQIYKRKCYMVRNDLFVRPLYDINAFFHDVSAPNKCGDLRVSRKGDSVLFTISKKNIKQLVFHSMVTNVLVLLPSFYLLYLVIEQTANDHVDLALSRYVFLAMVFFDSISTSCLSFFISDFCTNRYRRVSTEDFKFLGKLGCGSLILKFAVSFLSPLGAMETFCSSLSFSLPFVALCVTVIVSGSTLAKTSFWYARSCEWFYRLSNKESVLARGFNKCISWITKLSSLKSVENDTEERCVVN